MIYYKIDILQDNLIWLLVKNNQAIIIDCGDSYPIIKFLEANNLQLTHVLLTHAHADHVAGIKAIKQFTQTQIVASEVTKKYLNPNLIDITITNEQPLKLNNNIIQPIFTPGHCEDHIMYFFPQNKWLFSGDTLFTLGCGRAFFSVTLLFNSLVKVIKLLPKDTLIFPGHDYLTSNLAFLKELKFLNLHNQSSTLNKLIQIPTNLEFELTYNPFLNYNNQQFKQLLNQQSLSDLEFFTYLRKMKDCF